MDASATSTTQKDETNRNFPKLSISSIRSISTQSHEAGPSSSSSMNPSVRSGSTQSYRTSRDSSKLRELLENPIDESLYFQLYREQLCRARPSTSRLTNPFAYLYERSSRSSKLRDPFDKCYDTNLCSSSSRSQLSRSNSPQIDETEHSSLSNVPDSDTIVRHEVQHGYFKWTIENFSAFPFINDKHCLSPVFGLKESWWYLALHPRAKILGKDEISLNLIREKSDHGPTIVNVSYRLGLENYSNKIWFKPEENIVFGKGDSYGFHTSIFGHLEDFMHDGISNNNDSLSVLCEMYVKYALNVKKTLPTFREKSMTDKELPENITSLLTAGELTDVLIEIPRTKRVKAHSSVLCARSKTLARILGDGKSFIQLSCTPSCLDCVLIYMYTANFKFLAKQAVFGIGLYELACELSLDKLRELFTPQRIELKSKIVVESFKTMWTFHNFEISDIFSENIESEVYFDKTTGIGVKLILQKVTNYETVEMRVKVSGIVTALDFDFEMYLLDKDRQPVELLPSMFPRNQTVTLKNLIFTYVVLFRVDDVIRCSLFDGNLYIMFVCKKYSLMHLPDTNDYVFKEIKLDTNTWLNDLSADLNKLFISGYSSDVVVLTMPGQSFKLHRSILASRSTVFHKVFLYNQFKNDVVVAAPSRIQPLTWKLLFTYMYAGRLKDKPKISKSGALELYKVSEMFHMMSLKNKCEKLISRILDQPFARQVLRVANSFNNSRLKDICEKYLERYRQQNSSTDDSSAESSSAESSSSENSPTESSSSENSPTESSSSENSPTESSSCENSPTENSSTESSSN